MGSFIEINDTLLLSEKQGFPSALLDVAKHQQKPLLLAQLEGEIFSFCKEEARLWHRAPVRVLLVQKIEGRWLFWGHAQIISQTIERQVTPSEEWDGKSWLTKGRFCISKLYDPAYQKLATKNEAPAGLSFY